MLVCWHIKTEGWLLNALQTRFCVKNMLCWLIQVFQMFNVKNSVAVTDILYTKKNKKKVQFYAPGPVGGSAGQAQSSRPPLMELKQAAVDEHKSNEWATPCTLHPAWQSSVFISLLRNQIRCYSEHVWERACGGRSVLSGVGLFSGSQRALLPVFSPQSKSLCAQSLKVLLETLSITCSFPHFWRKMNFYVWFSLLTSFLLSNSMCLHRSSFSVVWELLMQSV